MATLDVRSPPAAPAAKEVELPLAATSTAAALDQGVATPTTPRPSILAPPIGAVGRLAVGGDGGAVVVGAPAGVAAGTVLDAADTVVVIVTTRAGALTLSGAWPLGGGWQRRRCGSGQQRGWQAGRRPELAGRRPYLTARGRSAASVGGCPAFVAPMLSTRSWLLEGTAGRRPRQLAPRILQPAVQPANQPRNYGMMESPCFPCLAC